MTWKEPVQNEDRLIIDREIDEKHARTTNNCILDFSAMFYGIMRSVMT